MKLSFRKPFIKTREFAENKPLLSFFILLAVIFLIIVAGSLLSKTDETELETVVQPKEVEVFSVGSAPKVIVPAKIEKSGVIKIVAQSGGIIQKVNVTEGQAVARGTNIVSISTNYAGGTAESTQRQISQKDFQYKKETLETERKLIELRREQTEKNYDNSEELREISRDSEKRTEEQIDLIDDMLDEVEDRIDMLESTNVGGVNDDAIFQLNQTRLQLLSSNNQLKTSLDQSQNQSSRDSNSRDLDKLNRDLTLKQLDLEEKSKTLALEISKLNLQLSRINEARMYPSSPVSGTIERVFVKPGQSVNPGDTIAIITGANNAATAIALVSPNIAKKVSALEDSEIILNGETISVLPTYISREPTEGNLYSIIYNIPEEHSSQFPNESYIDISIPIGYANSISTTPFIPVDSVYQTQDSSYVYVLVTQSENKKIAEIRTVEIGPVYGSFIEVKSGIHENDQIITNRNIVQNEEVILRGL